jgi:hypothetical protein
MQAMGSQSVCVTIVLYDLLTKPCLCPVPAGEAGFLPEFAFPFVKLFGPRAESSFEALVMLLLNWCKGWFELFPNPPVPLLRRFLVSTCDFTTPSTQPQAHSIGQQNCPSLLLAASRARHCYCLYAPVHCVTSSIPIKWSCTSVTVIDKGVCVACCCVAPAHAVTA